MQLDADARELLSFINARGRVSYYDMSPDQARRALQASRAVLGGRTRPVSDIDHVVLEGGDHPIPARVYRPGNKSDIGMLFFHGGGWVIGDLDTHDGLCRALCNECRATVVSVDYRLAPEWKFPAAFDDAVLALTWMRAQAAELGFPADRLVVAGDSAGANLAAGLALRPLGTADLRLYMQVLIYPALDQRQEQQSYVTMGSGYTLTADSMRWFRDNYLRGPEDRHDVRASPLLADNVADSAPAIIVTAGFDPLFDEGVAYAERLQEAGVPVLDLRYNGQMHGFMTMGGMLDAGDRAVATIGKAVLSPTWFAPP